MSKKIKNQEAMIMYENLKTSDESKIDVEELSNRNRGTLKKVWSNVQTLYSLAKSSNIPLAVKSTAIGALLYVISPVDAIPDITPMFGLVDDAGVVGAVMLSLKSFLDSPLGKDVINQSSEMIKKTTYKAKATLKDFMHSDTGKVIIDAVNNFVNDNRDIVVEDFYDKIHEVFDKDNKFGFSFFKSKKGKSILDVEGEVVIDAVEADLEVNQTERSAFKSIIDKHGTEIVAQAIDVAFNQIKNVINEKNRSNKSRAA